MSIFLWLMIVVRYLNKNHFDATFSPGHGMPWHVFCLALCVGKAFENLWLMNWSVKFDVENEKHSLQIIMIILKVFHFSFVSLWIFHSPTKGSILNRSHPFPYYEYPSIPSGRLSCYRMNFQFSFLMTLDFEGIKVVHFDSSLFKVVSDAVCSHTQGTYFLTIWKISWEIMTLFVISWHRRL